MFTTIRGHLIEYAISETLGVCHVKDSFYIEDRNVMREFIEKTMAAEVFKSRSVNSYIMEWVAHNRLYKLGIKKSSTKDVDLNVDESLIRRIIYFIISLWK